ncbi:hypothetical protein FA13DRAFT_1744697, partial [Coprinellus micaceus]
YLGPAVAASSTNRQEYSKRKAEEYEQKCGKSWIQSTKPVKYSGLESTLQQAHDEHPLKSPPPPAPSSSEHGKKH